MTGEQIEKGLEQCSSPAGRTGCVGCPYEEYSSMNNECIRLLQNDALAYIRRIKDKYEQVCTALKLAQARADDAEQAERIFMGNTASNVFDIKDLECILRESIDLFDYHGKIEMWLMGDCVRIRLIPAFTLDIDDPARLQTAIRKLESVMYNLKRVEQRIADTK